jgi:hypothetical protein
LVDIDGNNKNIVGLPNTECVHVFHSDCILEWLEWKTTCPCSLATYLPKMKAVTDIEEGTKDALEDEE